VPGHTPQAAKWSRLRGRTAQLPQSPGPEARLHRVATKSRPRGTTAQAGHKVSATRHDCTGWPQSLGHEARLHRLATKSRPRGTTAQAGHKVSAARHDCTGWPQSLGREARLHRLSTKSDEGHGFSRAIKAVPTTALAAEVRFSPPQGESIGFGVFKLSEMILTKIIVLKKTLGPKRC
jgi:hypothetical protein